MIMMLLPMSNLVRLQDGLLWCYRTHYWWKGNQVAPTCQKYTILKTGKLNPLNNKHVNIFKTNSREKSFLLKTFKQTVCWVAGRENGIRVLSSSYNLQSIQCTLQLGALSDEWEVVLVSPERICQLNCSLAQRYIHPSSKFRSNIWTIPTIYSLLLPSHIWFNLFIWYKSFFKYLA